jgi:hypothetical protein
LGWILESCFFFGVPEEVEVFWGGHTGLDDFGRNRGGAEGGDFESRRGGGDDFAGEEAGFIEFSFDFEGSVLIQLSFAFEEGWESVFGELPVCDGAFERVGGGFEVECDGFAGEVPGFWAVGVGLDLGNFSF